MTSRDAMLTRIRKAAAGAVATTNPRAYRRSGDHAPGSGHVLDLMVDRLVDYKAHVRRVDETGLTQAISDALGAARSVVLPPGLPEAWLPAVGDRTVFVDGSPTVLSAAELDRIDAVLTGARVAIALSGTIILDGGPDQGRRALTLVPDRHVVVLRADQVVETVAEGVAQLEPTAPLTMIAGPSATSDIELSRVEGVHGPRTLEVVIVN